MKTVIIGSRGFIGERLFESMKNKGFAVTGFSSSVPGGINRETGVLSKEFTIPEGTSCVIYLAQSPYYHQVPEMYAHVLNVNVVSAVRVADLARRAKVERFIYASTGSVYESSFDKLSEDTSLRRDNLYVLSKVHAEEALSLFKNNLDIKIARIFGVYGPRQIGKMVPNLIDTVLNGREVYIERHPFDENDMNGLRISLCYIDDAVEIFYKLMNGGPDVLNVAGKEAVSIRRLAGLIASSIGKEPLFKITEKCREFDLMADISLLQKTMQVPFTEVEAGITMTVESVLKDKRVR